MNHIRWLEYEAVKDILSTSNKFNKTLYNTLREAFDHVTSNTVYHAYLGNIQAYLWDTLCKRMFQVIYNDFIPYSSNSSFGSQFYFEVKDDFHYRFVQAEKFEKVITEALAILPNATSPTLLRDDLVDVLYEEFSTWIFDLFFPILYKDLYDTLISHSRTLMQFTEIQELTVEYLR